MDQMELKVQKSQGKLLHIKERRKDWENVNEKAGDVGFFNALIDLSDSVHERPNAEDLRKAAELQVAKENTNAAAWGGKATMPESVMPLQLPLRPSTVSGRPPPGIVGPSTAAKETRIEGLEDDID